MREVYWIGDRFIVEWEDGRVEEFEVEKIEELKKELNLRDRIEFELSMIEREVEKEELKVNWERIMNDIKKDYLEVESVEDLDDRLLLVECMDDFYGGDNWELFKWWMELEEVFMWLYDLSNE